MEDELELPKKKGLTVSTLLILALAIGLPASLGLGVFIGTSVLGGSRGSGPGTVPSVVKSAPPPAPSAPPPMTLPELAASGDYKALDELKAKAPSDRTAEETLALARGKSGNKARALEGFAKEIVKNADLLKDKDQLQRLKDFLADRETTNQAAGVLVALPGELGADLLYDAMTRPKANPETAQLAEDLLAAKSVREKASKALVVALELRGATDCEAFKALLPKAAESADRRSVPMLIKAANKRGCGDNKLADCYECIRSLEKDKEAIDLGDAMKAATKRAAPKY